eukprot:6491429-Amphidinium_carterae.1
MQLVRKCLVPPLDSTTRHWALLLNPSELGQRSKQGISDNSVIWDCREYEWFAEVLMRLSVGASNDCIWAFPYTELYHEVRKVTAELNIAFVPYQLRHSGPSWDRVRSYRTLAEIQKRGQWASAVWCVTRKRLTCLRTTLSSRWLCASGWKQCMATCVHTSSITCRCLLRLVGGC